MFANMCASRASERNAQEFYEMKQKAVKFYKENEIPERLEEILNSMFYENPQDVYGRLSEHFESLSIRPVIHDIRAQQVLDSRGQPTLQAEIHCIVKGLEKHLSTVTMASTNRLIESAPIERREEEDKGRLSFVDAALGFIRGPIREAVSGISPANQREIDAIICELLEKLKREKEEEERAELQKRASLEPPPPEPVKEDKTISPKGKKKLGSAKLSAVTVEEPSKPLLAGCNAACVVSQAVAAAAAKLKKIELFQHLGDLYSNQEPQQLELPTMMVNLLNSGKAYPGKQNLIKELLVIPKPGISTRESMKQLAAIHHQVGKILLPKLGVAGLYVNDYGGYCPQSDRPEQLVDLALEAITTLKLTPGEDIFLGLNCAGHEMFDLDKGKYEITQGSFKLPDDMVEVYADLVSRYPAVIALIDPLRKQDGEAWSKLCERLSENCFIIGDAVYPQAEQIVEEGLGSLRSSGVAIKLQDMTSVSDVMDATQLLTENNTVTVISSVSGESPDGFLADLAVGVGAKFVKFGAVNRGERIVKYNRLLTIEALLMSQNRICGTADSFGFPVIKPPEPEQTEEGKE